MTRTRPAAALLVVLAMSTTALRAAEEAAPWSYPLTVPRTELEAACGGEASVLDEWTVLDVRYDPVHDGVFGTLAEGRDIWIRDAEALRDHATISRYDGPLYRSRETVIEIWSPSTGKTRRLKESDLSWRGQVSTGYGIITLDAVVSEALIPGLRLGDRLRVVGRYEIRGQHAVPRLEFRTGKREPARQHARLSVPADQTLTFETAGPDSLTSRITHRTTLLGKVRQSTWVLSFDRSGGEDGHDVATVVPHLSVADGQRSARAFAGAADWAGAAAAYRESVNERLEPTPAITAEAGQIVAGIGPVRDRIGALYRHVQQATRYLGLFDGRGGIIPAWADETRRAGYGDCKGMATYFIALCRSVGIPAWPVLVLATDEEPFADTQPNLGQFNHYIAWADDGADGIWIDPTLEGMPPGVLVPDDAQHPVLTTRPGAEGLCRIPRHVWEPGLREYTVVGAVDAALRLRVEVMLSASGPGGELLAVQLARLGPRQRETLLRELLVGAQHRAAAVMPAQTADTTTVRSWRCGVESAQPLPGTASRRFLPAEIAALPVLVDRRVGSTWLPDPGRRPDRRETWRLELPAGWQLAAADSASARGPGVAWSRVVRQEGSELVLTRSLAWSDTTIAAAQEDSLRGVLDDIAEREKAPVMLVGEGR